MGSDCLLSNAESWVCLAALRSLGGFGVGVETSSEFSDAVSFHSRFSHKNHSYRQVSGGLFLDDLEDVLAEGGFEVFMPVLSEVLVPVLKERKRFEKFATIPFADIDLFELANDKIRMSQRALKLGIPCPNSFFVGDSTNLSDIRGELSFPILVKPSVSEGAKGILFIRSFSELAEGFERIKAAYGPVFLQEYIPYNGQKFAASVLLDNDSRPVRVFAQRMIRENPMSPGPHTTSESIDRKDIIDYVSRLMVDIGWRGVAQAEFVLDPRDNQPKFLEVNPRLWNSLSLSNYAGVNFPYWMYKLGLGEEIEPDFNYRVGVRSRWIIPQEIRVLFSLILNRRDPMYQVNKSRLRQIVELFDFFRGNQGYYILSANDPVPAFYYAKNWAGGAVKRIIGNI
ncbi:MAG: ATP-grasp domain-containing protein [Candidatus Altiarchaeota archaeon]